MYVSNTRCAPATFGCICTAIWRDRYSHTARGHGVERHLPAPGWLGSAVCQPPTPLNLGPRRSTPSFHHAAGNTDPQPTPTIALLMSNLSIFSPFSAPQSLPSNQRPTYRRQRSRPQPRNNPELIEPSCGCLPCSTPEHGSAAPSIDRI